jgi:hypothetical protein
MAFFINVQNDNGKMENSNAISETATPHPALSLKGRGNEGCHFMD